MVKVINTIATYATLILLGLSTYHMAKRTGQAKKYLLPSLVTFAIMIITSIMAGNY